MDSSVWDKVILGVNDTHDASACIINKGKILCAVAEERVQRVKSTAGFPKGAIDACLKEAGLELSDIDYVAVAGTRTVPVNILGTISTFNIKNFVEIQEKIRYPQYYGGTPATYEELFPDYKPKGEVYYPRDKVPLKETRELTDAEKKEVAEVRLSFIAASCGVPRERVFTIDHHTSHSYYAYYASPFRGEKILSLTLDAGGDGVYDSVNLFGEDGGFKRLHSSHDCIIAPLYTYVTLLLGMRPYEHEYKVMGLAPYAKEHVKRNTREQLLKFLSLDGVRFSRNPEIKDLYWHTKEILKYERFDGIAAGAQDFVEHFITAWVKNAISATGASKVVYSGGVSLNVKANKCLLELEELDHLFVPPGPGDESIAIGAAYALMDKLNPKGDHRERIEPLASGYLGTSFSEADVREFSEHPAVKGKFHEVEGDAHEIVADALVNNEIVGLCHGEMEFGPRALGHRSLIANPNSRETVTKINEAIKGRDFWMPFAPSIMKENLADYVRDYEKTDVAYMTVCFDSTPKAQKEIPAGLHPYDHTVRAQMVDKERSPLYHDILARFKRKSGIGGVLNTSLNIHGKPIVMKPVDIANELLNEEGVELDCLMIDRYFFRRNK